MKDFTEFFRERKDSIKKDLKKFGGKFSQRGLSKRLAQEYESEGLTEVNAYKWVCRIANGYEWKEHTDSLNAECETTKTPYKKSEVENTESWTESKEGAVWEYSGYKSIRTLKQAIKFSKVDLKEFEVDTYHFKSWDVHMKVKNLDSNGKTYEEVEARTNYYAHVKFRKIIPLEILKPKSRHIEVGSTKQAQMFVIIGCVHRPFHNKKLWKNFLRFLKDNKSKITGFVINGDYLDLRSLSSHEEWIPEGIDLSVEYSDGLQGIDEIESCLKKNIKKYFNYGNHEDRFFRNKKDARKYGSALPSPTDALELEKRGWEVNEDWKNGYITLGDTLDIYHGTKVGINAAADQLKALPNRDHIFNHTHRFGIASNRTHSAYNTGCMIDRDSDMFKYVDRGVRESWSNGFAVAYIDPKGKNYVVPIKCENNSFFFEGKIY
jgi:hypothetical protein